MKKIFAMLLAIVLVLCLSTAYALTWSTSAVTACDTYDIRLLKYEKVSAYTGSAFNVNPNAKANINDTVYFSVNVYDKDNSPIRNYNMKLVDLVVTGDLNGMITAVVTGPKPSVIVSMEERTAMNELHFGSMPVTKSSNTVMIGDLTFKLSGDVVVDVQYNGNALELTKELAKLGLTLEDIYSNSVCMSDDILVANFGRMCKAEKIIAWYNGTDISTALSVEIPKTGDASVMGLSLMSLITAAALWRRKDK